MLSSRRRCRACDIHVRPPRDTVVFVLHFSPHKHSFCLDNKSSHAQTLELLRTSACYLCILRKCVNVGTRTHRTTLSSDVINALKRLTSEHLFKSRHQTHSFFFFFFISLQITEVTVGGEKAPSERPGVVQRGRTEQAPRFQQRSLSSFTEGACHGGVLLLENKATRCDGDNGQ